MLSVSARTVSKTLAQLALILFLALPSCGGNPSAFDLSLSSQVAAPGNGEGFQGEGYPDLLARCITNDEPTTFDVIIQGKAEAATRTITILFHRNGESREVAPFTAPVFENRIYSTGNFRLEIDMSPESRLNDRRPATAEALIDGITQSHSLTCGGTP